MIRGRSGQLYDRRNNTRLVHAWDRVPPGDRARWYSQMRTWFIEEGVPPKLMVDFGPDQALGVAAIADGCPPHTLPRSIGRFWLRLQGWWLDQLREGAV